MSRISSLSAEKPEERLTECADCGAEIEGDASLTVERVLELTVGRHGAYVGRSGRDLWLCRNCGATLGVKR